MSRYFLASLIITISSLSWADGPDRIDIYRYYDSGFNNASHEVSQKQKIGGAEGYKGDRADYSSLRDYDDTDPDEISDSEDSEPISKTLRCSSLLNLQSFAALKYMYKRGAITKEMFQEQMTVNEGLDPLQPTFLHAWNETTTHKLIARYGKIPEFTRQDEIQKRYSDYFNSFDMGLLQDEDDDGKKPKVDPGPPDERRLVEAATLWIVAGQVPIREEDGRGLIKPLALPLKGNNGKKFLVHFPIEEGGRNFEVGHVTARVRGSLPAMLAHTSLLMYFDVRVTGGDLSKSYVNAHALDLAHKIVYERDYKMPPVASQLPEPETAFRKPLLDFIKDNPPSGYIEGVRTIIEGAGARLTELQALDIFFDMKDMGQRFLDFSLGNKTSKHAIVLRDFSNLRAAVILNKLKKYGVPPKSAKEIYSKINSSERTPFSKFDFLREQKIYGVTHYSPFGIEDYRKYLYENNAIEITGLDHKMADEDPLYTETAVLSVYNFILKDLKSRGIKDPDKFLENSGIKFIFTENFSGNFNPGFEKLKTSKTFIFSHPEVFSYLPSPFFSNYKDIIAPAQNIWANTLTADQLNTIYTKIRTEDTGLFKVISNAAFLGGSNLREKIYLPEHF